MRYAVLGAGRQGLAIAFDLMKQGGARGVTLVDVDRRTVLGGARRLRALAPGIPVRAVARRLEGATAVGLLRGHDAAVSALPYRHNPALARAALEAKVHFCDLGGNTDLVREALTLDRAARRAGVTIIPDCGLAPGLGNVLAAIAIDEVAGARHVRIRCGGLPAAPRGPLGYSLLFSIEGLTNEYTGEAVTLRGGKLRRFEAFTEVEPYEGPRRLGPLEAFFTSGGTSTAPWRHRGRLSTYEYKTVRYRGHFERVRAMIDLGLLSLEPVDGIVPRDAFHRIVGPRLLDPHVRDLAILRVDCTDLRGAGVRYEMLQFHDAETGFTAMEQTTGYPTALVAAAMARGELRPGAYTPDAAGFDAAHLRALRRRGLRIRRIPIGPGSGSRSDRRRA